MIARKLIAAAAMLVAATAANAAAPVFSDNFDTQAQALNQTNFLNGWAVSNGTIDVIPVGADWNLIPGNGNYIDLDGSTGQAGTFFNTVSLDANTTYVLTFSLAGNQRGAGSDTVNVTFGGVTSNLVIGQSDALTAHSLTFTTTGVGSYGFSFHNEGGDNQGALLDNVSISAVPEPETYGMMLAGLAALGFAARRRRQG